MSKNGTAGEPMTTTERQREVLELFELLHELRTLDPENYAEVLADMRRQAAGDEK